MLDPSRRCAVLEMQGRWILDFILFYFPLLSFLRTAEEKIGDHRHRPHCISWSHNPFPGLGDPLPL